MNNLQQRWLGGSIGSAFLRTLLVVSIIPIVVVSAFSIPRSTKVLTTQTQANLQALAQANAETIHLKLNDVLNITQITAVQVEQALDQNLSEAEVQARMARYQTDERNILGLDQFYKDLGKELNPNANRSNVYWNNTVDPSLDVRRQIVQTESLDPFFESVKSVSPSTQWIYFTTAEGIMRLYPWAGNDHYPDNWDPRKVIFYTVAEPSVNPKLEPRWTAPYVDFAGAGWMVTLSVPLVDKDNQFKGIVSHDITIQALKDIALKIDVLDGAGYGFLIDHDGGVIAHPQYESNDASKGSQEQANLLNQGTDSFRGLVKRMVAGEQGVGYYVDENNQEQLLAFSPISNAGWSLGLVVPRTKVVAVSTSMRNETLLILALLVTGVISVSILFTRLITRPLHQLLHGVNLLSHEGDDAVDMVAVKSFTELNRLSDAFNEMSRKVRKRESGLKAKVQELKIEVDAQRQKTHLESIVESDFFKQLEATAERLRNGLKEP